MKINKFKDLSIAIYCFVSVFCSEIQGMERIIDGDYKICCFTQNGGPRYLEACPGSDLVKAVSEKDSKNSKELPDDQKWSLKLKNDYYKISCFTDSGGIRYLEAFPNEEVKPRAENPLSQNQKWFIEHIENDYYRIGCNIKDELKYLEAFPGLHSDKLPDNMKESSSKVLELLWGQPVSGVYMKPKSSDQDQKWKFIKVQ